MSSDSESDVDVMEFEDDDDEKDNNQSLVHHHNHNNFQEEDMPNAVAVEEEDTTCNLPYLGLDIPSSWKRMQDEETLLLNLTEPNLVLPGNWNTLAFTEQVRLANMYRNNVTLSGLGILNGTHDFSFLATDDARITQLLQKPQREKKKKE